MQRGIDVIPHAVPASQQRAYTYWLWWGSGQQRDGLPGYIAANHGPIAQLAGQDVFEGWCLNLKLQSASSTTIHTALGLQGALR